MRRPKPSPIAAAMPTPRARRWRLAAVSLQNRMVPERWSGSVMVRTAVSRIWEGAGSSRSCGLSARRIAEPAL